MDLIDRIRRENGCDEALLLRAHDDPEIIAAIEALKGNANRGLERLSDELYSRDTHFLMEFLQNADDNHYEPNVVPELCLSFEDDRIRIECNEIGFNKANVQAICKIGASTKRSMTGYIGEKGIGFKSVFKVAEVVHISSGIYTFKLDRREEMGMITPIWSPSLQASPGTTLFILELSQSTDANAVSAHLSDIRPSLLLFLRKLRSVITQGPFGPQGQFARVQIHREDVDQDVVLLKRVENGMSATEKFFVVPQSIKTYRGEIKRLHVTQTDIVIAFPLAEDETPKVMPQDIYAFLPLRSYGFTFVVQADFLTSTNREDILADLRWNITLRDAIADSFLTALNKLKSRATLEFTWIRFLPHGIVDPFFTPVEASIISKLANLPVIRAYDGTYDLPSKFIVAKKSYCGPDGITPIIPEAHLPDGLHYLPSSYNNDMDGAHFIRLGVLHMSDEHFLRGLQLMHGHLSTQTSAWHEAMCQSLYLLPRLRHGGLRIEIQRLLILPLDDDSWISGLSSTNVFFKSKLSGIPTDLGLRIIATHIPSQSWTYRLYEQLGVRESDSQRVANKILELHRRSNAISLRELLSHATFMFVHRHSRAFPSAAGLRVADEDGKVVMGHDIYADILSAQQSKGMRGLLPPPARFIHANYLQADLGEEWKQWLCDSVGVNTHPRLVHGQLSPEFNALAHSVDTKTLLIVLRESWSQWSPKLSTAAYDKLSEIVVQCGDGRKFKLKETFVKRGVLANYLDIPFLPVDNPDSHIWDFLSRLGVTMQVDGPFFLRRLRNIRKSQIPERASVEDTYKQLEARFDDDPQGIRNAFSKESLIFAFGNSESPGRWLTKSEAVWDSPMSMTSKFAVKSAYPSLQKLFQIQLALPVAGPEILADELQFLASRYHGQTIPLPVQKQIHEYLLDISDALWGHPTKPAAWLHKLSNQAIFPVVSTSQGTVLCSADDHFYIPDEAGRFQAIFANVVPLLVTTSTFSLSVIKPILESDIFKSRLKYLDISTTHVCLPKGPRQFESLTSAKYARMSHFVERLWHKSRRVQESHGSLEALEQLRNIRVFTVDAIESTFTLDNITRVDQEDLTMEQDSAGLLVVMSKSCFASTPDIALCNRLALSLNVDVHTLFTFASQSPETIEQLMKIQGIPEITVLDQRHRGSFEAAAHNTDDAVSQSHSVLLPAAPGVHAHSDSDRMQLADGLQSILNLESTCSMQNVPVMAMGFDVHTLGGADAASGFTAAETTSSYVERASARTSVKATDTQLFMSEPRPADSESVAGQDVMTITGKPEDTDHKFHVTGYQLVTGILGESFIYASFLKELPGFGPENWTSEWRGHYPGMPPYEGPSLADFVYPDCEGILTKILYGEETKTAWDHAWPTYHLEVKTTSGARGEAFHLSCTQMEHAFHLTSRDSVVPPKELYVIVRVSRIRTTPAYSFYRDPHRLFYEGGLRIASGVEVTRGSA